MERPDLEIIVTFEKMLAEYCGSKYAVSVDCGTHAIELALRLVKPPIVFIPRNEYRSVINVVRRLDLEMEWTESRELPFELTRNPSVFDACGILPRFESFVNENSIVCLSFTGARKPINMPKGGAILCNNIAARDWFLAMRWHGTETEPGLYYWLSPEDAAHGIRVLTDLMYK